MFKYRGNLNGGHERTLIKVVLAGSADFKVGDPVSISTSESVIVSSAGLRVLGHIAAIIQKNGVVPSSDGCSGAFVQTYRTASTNASTELVAALVDVDPNSTYSVDLDDTVGTTTGSNKALYMFDLDTGTSNRKLDESSAGQTSGQYFGLGLDPNDTNRQIVKLKESVLLGDSGY